MDFVDSFTNLQEQPQADLVKRYYRNINDFFDKKSEAFLEDWSDGPEAVLFFNYSERERGGEKVKKTFRQIREVLARVPVDTRLEAAQITYCESGDLAYAVTAERVVNEFGEKKTILGEYRNTLIWKKHKLVHVHSDLYDRRDEVMSEMLRSYHPEA